MPGIYLMTRTAKLHTRQRLNFMTMTLNLTRSHMASTQRSFHCEINLETKHI